MKSKVAKDRFYIECSCTSPDHLLVFDFWDFGKKVNYTEMSAQFTSPYHDSFWKRLGYFFKYLFNKERYLGTSDTIVFNKKNLEQLKEVVAEMERILDKEEKKKEATKTKIQDKKESDFLEAQIGTLNQLLEQAKEFNDQVGLIQIPEQIKEAEEKLKILKQK